MDTPWQLWPLNEWYICSMNHYDMAGEKYLYVGMTKDYLYIIKEIFNRIFGGRSLSLSLEFPSPAANKILGVNDGSSNNTLR